MGSVLLRTRSGILMIVAIAVIAAVIIGIALQQFAPTTPGKVRLVYATAGDINMLALIQNVIAPEFTKRYPNVEIASIHTGPGEPGSRIIFEKLKAARDAGKECWDVDVAVVHQIFMSWALKEGLLLNYSTSIPTWKYVVSEDAYNALGTYIKGFGIPLFHSQIAIAYNTKYVQNPPRSYDELVKWVEANPKKFGHNGIRGGMSGVGFVVGWVYWKTGMYDTLARGPYNEALKDAITKALEELKVFNEKVVITAGNVGTLDMLAREEIWMGPVWVDMFMTWLAEGRMPPHIKLTLLAPGLPGQPMYLVIPAKACNVEWAKKLIEFISSPETQAKVIVEKYNWYPGIDPNVVLPHVSEEAKARLFSIPPEDLQRYGKSFPVSQYFTDILKLYEKVVG
ncbi:MAG: extracellular solute-binding protein [Ignisphaera sp.]|nr:extracellular solute-binding protein [Ignisphaera sp.]MDW8085632.1 extracellular solute-binding protein [Ignisphaera sp.]